MLICRKSEYWHSILCNCISAICINWWLWNDTLSSLVTYILIPMARNAHTREYTSEQTHELNWTTLPCVNIPTIAICSMRNANKIYINHLSSYAGCKPERCMQRCSQLEIMYAFANNESFGNSHQCSLLAMLKTSVSLSAAVAWNCLEKVTSISRLDVCHRRWKWIINLQSSLMSRNILDAQTVCGIIFSYFMKGKFALYKSQYPFNAGVHKSRCIVQRIAYSTLTGASNEIFYDQRNF